jgi:DNA polymerase-3 subunit delta'
LISERLRKDKGLAAPEASVLAQISGGSLGRALQMSADQYLPWRQDQLARLIQSADRPLADVLKAAWEDSEKAKKLDQGWGLPDLLALWLTWYRDLLVVKSTQAVAGLINQDHVRELQNWVGRFSIHQLAESVLNLEQAQKDLSHSRNADLVMSHTVLNLKRAGRFS